MKYIVAMSGASGAPYAMVLIEQLLKQGHTVHLTITEAGWRVLQEEHGWEVRKRETLIYEQFPSISDNLHYHSIRDIGASIASGSYPVDGMVVIPCSMGTLSKIAQGNSSNLLERSADVMLKEKRPLIIVPRETPLNTIHLENMLKLSRMGVSILPAMPAFYTKPRTMEDMVQFVAGKVLDLLHLSHSFYQPWKGERDA